MKVGVLEKNLPMELECLDEKNGVYNVYAPGRLDIDWIIDLVKNPPEEVNYLAVFAEDGKREIDSLMEYFSKYNKVGKWYKFEKEGFIHYIIDLKGKGVNCNE
jgi:hypothetical protein